MKPDLTSTDFFYGFDELMIKVDDVIGQNPHNTPKQAKSLETSEKATINKINCSFQSLNRKRSLMIFIYFPLLTLDL